MNESMVGKKFIDENGKIWKMISYCEHPSADFENIETHERFGGAIGSPTLSKLQLIKYLEEK